MNNNKGGDDLIKGGIEHPYVSHPDLPFPISLPPSLPPNLFQNAYFSYSLYKKHFSLD